MRRGYAQGYFSRPPLRSTNFLLNTIWLAILLSMALFFGKRYYARLSAEGLWWMGLAAAAPIILWLQARRAHSKLYRLYEVSLQERSSAPDSQTHLDSVLEQAAYLEDTGLWVASSVLMAALLGLAEILRK